jgi:putative ABC transport system permease protein
MNLLTIAWRSIQQRWLASLLTSVSMALGVLLVVMVLSIHNVVLQSFQTNASLGYNMIVGAKGGKLQLTLNTVYYLSQPVENIPYDYYLEFFEEDRRREEYQQSFAAQARRMEEETAQLQALAASAGCDPAQGLVTALAAAAIEHSDQQRRDQEQRDGTFGRFTSMAIPLCLGDYLGQFRVVGTVPEMFEQLKYGPEGDREFKFSQGRNFRRHSPEHGYFEAVIGSKAAWQEGLSVGDTINPAHGTPDGHKHARKFTIVGVLAPTGTPNDRAVFINIDGFYLMEDHAKPLPDAPSDGPPNQRASSDGPPNDGPPSERAPPEELTGKRIPLGDEAEALAAAAGKAPPHSEEEEHLDPLPIEQREVTAILIGTKFFQVAPGMENMINEGPTAQAVAPVREIYNLFSFIVEPIQWVLLGLTAMICVVSGISILVSIYNSMSDRRHEIAVMRALGAGRETVMMIILLESILLSAMGGGAGWLLAHVINALASGTIEERTGVVVRFQDFAPTEWFVVAGLLILAVIVGFLPALSAYRTDVARSLGK